jgi:ribosomal 50S subunit-associated protein YjgA (DUF615 family)
VSESGGDNIKAAVEAADLSAEKKSQLLGLVSKLQVALASVSQTHQADAQNITRLAQASAQEATRRNKRPEKIRSLLHELKESVQHFEASHPELVEFVTEYSALLAEMGI